METRYIKRILNQKENMAKKKQTKYEDNHEPKKKFETKGEFVKKRKSQKDAKKENRNCIK